MPRLSVSSWSLHRALGEVYADSPVVSHRAPETPFGRGNIDLLELPAKIAAMGIHTLEICHFHLPSLEDRYFDALRSALDEAGVSLYSILIDDGDITHPQHGERDRAWIAGWLENAGRLGAERARVIAGKSTDDGALARSKAGLRELVEVAEANNVRLMTENWFGVLSNPAAIHAVFDAMGGRMGFCFDFGNWGGENKYDDLAQIVQYAESCHAKCSFAPPLVPDKADYERCLDITKAAGFDGPYTLIYDGPDDDEWAGLAKEIEMVGAYLSG